LSNSKAWNRKWTPNERNYRYGRGGAGGGFTARALDDSVFTEADTWEEVKQAVEDAVRTHFEDETYQARIIKNLG
jgi:hypothetical protein